jgi:hypothetical protein
LSRDDGLIVSDHHENAGILWHTFHQRLGFSTPIEESFNFHDFIQPTRDLSSLSAPFSHDEIDNIIKDLPTDKAPGPDGFSRLFIKICWSIIKFDFYRLCEDFWNGKVNLQSINDAFIILIPKNNSPVGSNDYRPISLLNIIIKILTKLLATRLQLEILKLVHVNQYGFLKSRTI